MSSLHYLENTPSVSVIITCYNYGRYLDTCLSSVIAQTYKDYEIVVIDDGSTDNTQDVIEPYLSMPNLRYIRQANAGQACAKNTGTRNSSGRFVAFLDADDAWEPSKLAKQMVLFSNDSIGVVFSRFRFMDEHDNVLDEIKVSDKYLLPRKGKVADYFIFDNFVPFSSSVVRRECLIRCGSFDESLRMGIDWDLWLRISTEYEFDFVNEPLMMYRLGHSGQMSKNLEERFRCSDRIVHNFLDKYKDLFSPQIIKRAYTYAYYCRGIHFRKIDWSMSDRYFLDTIRINPTNLVGYLGLLKNVLYRFVQFIHDGKSTCFLNK
jgi:glycosyltransferase involved in cell wall biosynthesis